MQTGMHGFHRDRRFLKTGKYLLITHSFPHSPQIFPQELSTGRKCCGYSFLVHIKLTGTPGGMRTFFADSIFHHGEIFVQKFGLDKIMEPEAGEKRCGIRADKGLPDADKGGDLSENRPFEKNLKKGVDFAGQTRYNVCLYGKLEEGGALNGKYQVL